MIAIDPSEVTPEQVYLNRRRFMIGAAALVSDAFLAACSRQEPLPAPTIAPGVTPSPTIQPAPTPTRTPDTATPYAGAEMDELGDKLTPFNVVTNYNNYYEFSLGKEDVGVYTASFKTSPWKVDVSGLVRQPKTFDLDDLLKFGQEERIYRLRCVETWSMVIPWVGFPLRKLLDAVEPAPEAKFVRFETILAPEQMPGQRSGGFGWPYAEGLRLDEAMHELTILATGLYGKPLPPQDGAPIRLVVPWKYGFKDIKSIVKITLVEEMPATFWSSNAPEEYGFYANVNPDVPHPRWSQATERRIGESGRRRTLLFNGYAEEVARLYEGMDLQKNY